jgi:uncharacterized protein YbaP (TraB family)
MEPFVPCRLRQLRVKAGMRSGRPLARLIFVCTILSGSVGQSADAASCVWKVTSPSGGTLFLGGSVHALRSSDYPLPAPYLRALDASSRLAFETDLASNALATKGLLKAGRYSKGDNLKNHVDPRTYSYVRRYFALQNVPEQKFNTYRPWLIGLMLEAAPTANNELGVEQFLKRKAQPNHKPITGLESVDEHMAPFVGLSDRESEALLLVHFINLGRGGPGIDHILASWRRGDADTLVRTMGDAFQEFPAFMDRIITARNRRWIPKIEGFLKSGQTYFVVAGAGHMGGSNGVVALLRARGYTVDQW